MSSDVVVAPERAVAPLLRLTVSGGDRHADLAVPDGVPVVELLPDLARAVGLLDADAAPGGYRLATSGGQALRPGHGLGEQGVSDGARLVVVAGEDVARARVHDDPAEAIADAVEHLDVWSAAATRRTTLGAVGLLLLIGPVALLLAGTGAVPGVAAAAAALVLGAAGVWVARERPTYGVGLVLLAAPYAACAGLLLVAGSGVAGVPLAAAGLAGAAAGAVAWSMPGARPLGLGVTAAGGVVGVAGVVQSWWVPDLLAVAPAMLALVTLAGSMAPWLVVGPAADDLGGTAERVRRAHDWLLALSVATGILLVLLVPPVVDRGSTGAALAATGSAAVLLRTRHHRVAAEVLTGIVSGVGGLLVAAGAVAVLHPGWRPVVAVALPLAGLLLLAGTLLPAGSPLQRARLADVAESAVLLALLPLMVVALGLLDRVVG